MLCNKIKLCHKIQFCVTKLNFESQNSILSNKIQFCVTEFNFVSQNSNLCHKIQLCVTKFNFVVHKLDFFDLAFQFLCRLRSIATHRDHFVRRLSVCPSVCPSVTLFCHIFQSYVSQATHAFLRMLSLFFNFVSNVHV